MTAPLVVDNLSVSFPTDDGLVQAVRGVSFEVGERELLGVVGESGSGKSVTFLAVMGLLPKSAQIEGSVKVNGTELVGASAKVLQSVRGKQVAMIFQDPLTALNPTHRVGAQIAEMLRAHDRKLSKPAAIDRAAELLGTVGIPNPKSRVRQYPHEFSGGMRQRAMIAMAIANNPSLLIADEPTTALDTTVQAQILEVIDDIKEEFGTAVAFITHDLGVVARIATAVQVMYAGRIVEKGTVDQLFSSSMHPYTGGLLSSLPHPGAERLLPIPGSPPNMLNPPSGCAFRPRCPHATEVCAGDLPDLRTVGDSETACVRIEEIMGANA